MLLLEFIINIIMQREFNQPTNEWTRTHFIKIADFAPLKSKLCAHSTLVLLLLLLLLEKSFRSGGEKISINLNQQRIIIILHNSHTTHTLFFALTQHTHFFSHNTQHTQLNCLRFTFTFRATTTTTTTNRILGAAAAAAKKEKLQKWPN